MLDESMELRVGRLLRSLGHDVTAIVRDYTRSISDIDVLYVAHAERRVLVTNDRDFTFLVFNDFRFRPHSGVILFRLGRGGTIEDKLNAIRFILTHHTNDLDAFFSVHPEGITVRRTPIVDGE
jgi:predicted nuclease of predicted toxin-antitoxin system